MTKTGNYSEAETKDKYKYELVAERILNRPMERTRSDTFWMKHGRETEWEAAEFFKKKYKLILRPGGFIKNNVAGCSPDRIVEGKNEIVEIKCPAPWTHLQYLREGLNNAYEVQVQAQLWITEADVVHFFSYWPEHENIPPVYLKRIRSPGFVNKVRDLAERFALEVAKAERECLEKGCDPIQGFNY